MNDVYHSMFDKITMSDEKMQEILQLNDESQFSHKRYSIRRLCAIPAACAAIIMVLTFGPTKIYAEKMFHELVGLVHVNKESVTVGESEWLDINMPKDAQELEYDGATYEYKSYDELSSLEDDLDIKLLDFYDAYEVSDEVCFQVEDGQAGSVNMVINHEDGEDNVLPVTYTLYFSTTPDESTGNLNFKDTNNSYVTYDVEENTIKINVKKGYNIVETYQSQSLDTNVLILEKNLDGVSSEGTVSDTGYYAIFVYQNVEYQLFFNTDINSVKEVIEQMK